MPEDTASTRVISRHTLLSLYLPALILALGAGIATPALPVLAKSFDISFGVASLVIIVYSLGSATATLPVGYLIDRIGRRKVLLAGPILTALSAFLIVTAQNFPQLLLYRFIGGWAYQMWMMSRIAIIADTGSVQQRGRQITGMSGMDGVGKLLGPAIGGFIAAIGGVRLPFLLYGLLALLAIIPSFRLVQETAPTRRARPTPTSETTAGDAQRSMAVLLAFPFLMLFLARTFESLTRGALQGGTINLYTVYAYNVGPEVIGLLGTIAAVIGIPITLTAGQLMDRLGRKATLIPGFTLLGVGHALMAVTAYAHFPFGAYIGVFLWVYAAQSLTGGNMQTLGSDLAPPSARGRFFGTYNLISQTGQMLSPVFFALLAGAFSYFASFAFLSVMALGAAFVLGTQVKETLRRELSQPVRKPATEAQV